MKEVGESEKFWTIAVPILEPIPEEEKQTVRRAPHRFTSYHNGNSERRGKNRDRLITNSDFQVSD